MKRARILGGVLIIGLAAIAVTFVVGMRRKTPVVLDAVRRSSRATKPLVLRAAGQSGAPTSVVEHVGRTSGRRYETPVVAAPLEDGFAIALPYGHNTDWLKNVLTAGRATIRFDGHTYDVDRPERVEMQEVDEYFGPKERRLHRRFQVRDALVVRKTRGDGATDDAPLT